MEILEIDKDDVAITGLSEGSGEPSIGGSDFEDL